MSALKNAAMARIEDEVLHDIFEMAPWNRYDGTPFENFYRDYRKLMEADYANHLDNVARTVYVN